MLTMNIKDARASLGKLVGRAEQGETVIITRHGKKSARLMPLPTRAKGLPSLREFRAGIAESKVGLSATVMAARCEERT